MRNAQVACTPETRCVPADDIDDTEDGSLFVKDAAVSSWQPSLEEKERVKRINRCEYYLANH